MSKGQFIVIEGSDGSGKGTQFELLAEYLRQTGNDVATFDFPQYTQPSSYFVQQYLNGRYGSADSLGAYGPSLFYALDRFDASIKIREALEAGEIVLCNRYYGSNLAHQGQKIDSPEDRKKYYDWLRNIELTILGIPEPDVNLVLVMPAEIAQGLVDKKEKRNYTDMKRDIHEADLNHLKRAVATFEELCELYPNSFTPIYCTTEGSLKSIEEVHQEIIKRLSK